MREECFEDKIQGTNFSYLPIFDNRDSNFKS